MLFVMPWDMGICVDRYFPDSKVHGTNIGHIWVLSAPDGPHIGPMNLVIRVCARVSVLFQISRIVLYTMRLHTGGIYILQSYEKTYWKDVQYFVTDENLCPSFAMCNIVQRWMYMYDTHDM